MSIKNKIALTSAVVLLTGCMMAPSAVIFGDGQDGDVISNPFGDKFAPTTTAEVPTNSGSNKNNQASNQNSGTTTANAANSQSNKTTTVSGEAASDSNGVVSSDELIKSVKLSKAKISKAKYLKPGKTKALIKLKKVNYATGYQIKYSTSKKFKKKVTKTTTSKKLSKKIKKLKSGKKYFVKARAYVLTPSGKQYGKWSKVKTIK
ncbi:MAG: hypothetical protein K6G88_01590 [Lachnospiraceae bacterium]|nr:hypothetical protein [Lachnospiraceae bacterium]